MLAFTNICTTNLSSILLLAQSSRRLDEIMPTVNILLDGIVTNTPTLTLAQPTTIASGAHYSSLPVNATRQPLHYAGALFFVLGVCIILIAVTIYSFVKRYAQIKEDALNAASLPDNDTLMMPMETMPHLSKVQRSSSTGASTIASAYATLPKKPNSVDSIIILDRPNRSAASSATTLVESAGRPLPL
ncbi:uncharacterized protein SCHCODRAFT_02514192 [Schizophyllum commune H4-8]|nr:uncharacterized protein SCHCODRAFT_02514192 [Schizophyllum commune H4-8]KAI5888010.1 hypothetical protein SCHCODRAFT_02514192 [Schizophyllum commune H4-8]